MRKLGFIISILICSVFFAFAQNEGNIWYFGDNAGLDFNSGSPVALTNGMLYTMEGCATISDNNGDLLFYTDGMTVYNKSHTIMPNGLGLLGHISSTQSGIIVKKPGSTTIYYIFTVDGMSGNFGGLNYSEVDMTLQGGYGDINANKNIPLFPNACEKITAIKHQNNSDYWIVARLENSNTYHSYLLTSSGINMAPIVTNIGPIYINKIGYLRGSSDGKKIAAVNYQTPTCDLFDFDDNTGVLSNPFIINTPVESASPYGVEFSSNSSVLYVSGAALVQYDLLAGSNTAIINSVLNIGNAGGALQLGPDQKIYQAHPGYSYLSVVNNPNVVGIGCNFSYLSLSLGGRLSQFGLPTFYSSIFVQTNNFSFNNPCYGDSAIFNISNMSVDSVFWNFGDPNSGTNNISTSINPFHIFSDTGTFHITLYSYFNGMIDTIVNDLFVTDLPIINLGNDTIICDGAILTLDATVQNATYLWQDNSANSTYDVIDVGDYFVEVTANGCSNSDTIHVIYNHLPEAIISGNYEACDGDQIFIDVIINGTSPFEITYTTGTETNIVSGNNPIIIEANQAGIYTITEVVDQFGCIGSYSGSAEVIINPCSLSVYIPNSFTPNNDSYNKGFMPSIDDINDVVNYNMTILNRWGEVVYETNEIGRYWDGKFNNIDVQQGVYVYIITITDIYNNSHNFNRYVYLIR